MSERGKKPPRRSIPVSRALLSLHKESINCLDTDRGGAWVTDLSGRLACVLIQATAQRPKRVEAFMNRVPFFSADTGDRKQFPSTEHECSFGFGEPRRQLSPVGFDQRCFLEIAPSAGTHGFGAQSFYTHELSCLKCRPYRLDRTARREMLRPVTRQCC